MTNIAYSSNLSIRDKAAIKRDLIKVGINPSGMNDVELVDAHKKLNNKPAPAPKVQPAPHPEPAPAPKVEPKVEPKVNPLPKSIDPAHVLQLLGELLGKNTVFDEARVIELIKQHAPSAGNTLRVEIPEKTPVTIPNAHKQFAEVLAMVTNRLNVYMVGPAGSGKTTIAEQCAKALDLPFYPMGAVFQKYELTGYNDAEGAYVSTGFRQAMEFGGVFLYDEMDASDSAALVAFNAALANGFYQFPDKLVHAHKDFYVIAAGNTYGFGPTRQYTGRNALDAATLDRYAIIDIEYDEDLEEMVTLSKANGDADLTQRVLNVVRQTRARASELRLNCLVSPRASYDIAKMVAGGIAFNKAITYGLWNKLDATSRKQLEC